MNIFKKVKEKFKTVYCEDCKNCMPSDGHEEYLVEEDGPMCKAYPIEIDCSDIDTFVKKDRKIKIIKTFQRCRYIRSKSDISQTYFSYCFKYEKKSVDK